MFPCSTKKILLEQLLHFEHKYQVEYAIFIFFIEHKMLKKILDFKCWLNSDKSSTYARKTAKAWKKMFSKTFGEAISDEYIK